MPDSAMYHTIGSVSLPWTRDEVDTLGTLFIIRPIGECIRYNKLRLSLEFLRHATLSLVALPGSGR